MKQAGNESCHAAAPRKHNAIVLNAFIVGAAAATILLSGCDRPAPVVVTPSPSSAVITPSSPSAVIVAPMPPQADEAKAAADRAADAARDANRSANSSKDAAMDSKDAANKASMAAEKATK